jgi:hypothetical protein
VHALWEGGSAAFRRDDAWSDVDLLACVDDERVAETFAAVEAELQRIGGIEAQFVVPEPAWHGHAQRFYRLRGQEPWLVLDLCVVKRSNPNRLLEREIHGDAVFLFDKIGVATAAAPPADGASHEKKLRARIEHLRARTRLLAHLVEKECRRRHPLDAFGFYQSLILAPLVEMLRIRYDPWRHDFGLRYLHDTLPPPLSRRLQELCFVRNLDDLQSKQRIALRWFDDLATDAARAPKLVFTFVSLTPRKTKPPQPPPATP